MNKFALTFALLISLAGCDCDGRRALIPDTDAGRTDTGGPPPATCTPGGPAILCSGTVETTCNADGTFQGMRDCAVDGLVCSGGRGCSVCTPGQGSCDGNTTQVCGEDANSYVAGEVCDDAAGQTCDNTTGTCKSLCNDAEASNSYIGCEYWPTPVMNSGIAAEMSFAVVVSNPQAVPATITVRQGGTMVANTSVAAGTIETIRLPWNALKNEPGMEASSLVPNGAYQLNSTVPVTVYQFNALEYRVDGDCAGFDPDPFDNSCFSYTNDASLLLPTHVLTGNYMVVSRPTRQTDRGGAIGDSPGFFAVIGVDAAPTEISVDFSSNVRASRDGMVRAFGPGETGTFTLNQGDVLQIASATPPSCSPGETDEGGTYCRVGPTFDVTGTVVRAATGRVAVISGHNCAFVPSNRWACDHLEEAMFPLQSWGKDYVIGISQPLRSEPNLIQIVSGSDGNTVTFDPPVNPGATLAMGQVLEFESTQDFRVTGTGAFSVGQLLVGQDYAGILTSGEMGNGDPALSLAIPTEQFRNDYSFLAPTTYIVNFVNVTAPTGTEVMLDGNPVTGWRAVGGSGMSTARVEISGGPHEIQSGTPFGIVVYGFGSYTSYMYPGGLDFNDINPLI